MSSPPVSIVRAGFTVGELAARVHAMTGRTEADYPGRQPAYDLRNCGPRPSSSSLIDRAATRYRRTRSAPSLPSPHCETRCSPPFSLALAQRPVRERRAWSAVEHDYETLRIDMEALFNALGIATAAQGQSFVDGRR